MIQTIASKTDSFIFLGKTMYFLLCHMLTVYDNACQSRIMINDGTNKRYE